MLSSCISPMKGYLPDCNFLTVEGVSLESKAQFRFCCHK